MKNFIYTVALIAFLAVTATAQKQSSISLPNALLHVEVENGKTLDLTTADLTKFPRREIKAVGHDEKESSYSGYNLSDILLAAGARIGKNELKGKELAAYLVVEAADNYKATFSIAEIAPEFTDKIILLADTRDGKPFDAKTGAWQIIVPSEKKHGRWVRQVISLKLKKV